MGLFLNNHIGLLKNKLRYSANPDLQYLKTTVRKKLLSFPNHLNHYQRFVKEPNIGSKVMIITGLPDDYGPFFKLIAEIFNVRACYRLQLIPPDLEAQPCITFVGNVLDIDLAVRMTEMCIMIVRKIEVDESVRYRKMVIAQRRKRQRGGKTQDFAHAVIYSREFRVKLIAYLNSLLINILDKKLSSPNFKLIDQYLFRNYPTIRKDKRGNPNWGKNREKYLASTHLSFKSNDFRLL